MEHSICFGKWISQNNQKSMSFVILAEVIIRVDFDDDFH